MDIETFITAGFRADNDYITNGAILLRKNTIGPNYELDRYRMFFYTVKTEEHLPLDVLPFEKGEPVEMSENAKIGRNNKIYVNFGGKFFNYDLLEFIHELNTQIDYYTLVETERGWFLKFWSDGDDFLGCLGETTDV